MTIFEKPSYVDHIEREFNKLINGDNGEYWSKVFTWFSRYKPEDDGVQFVWDSLFTNKYIQSVYMYKGMFKFILYLYRSLNEDDFPYEYSSKRINGIKSFWERNFVLSTGAFAGKPFLSLPNQTYKLSRIYGFSVKEDKKEEIYKDKGIKFMVNRFYDVETRKNGKSEWVAGLGVFVQQNPFGNDAQPEVFAAGPQKDASDIIWEKAKDFIKGSELLRAEYEAINTRRVRTYSGGTFKSLAFEKKSLEGKNPSFSVNTEYHLAPTDLMVDSQESALNASRPNSLMMFDTTKGEGVNGVAYQREHLYKDNIDAQLEKPQELLYENVATFMAELDDEDDYAYFMNEWDDNIFRKSTPMLGEIISLGNLQQEWMQSKDVPQKRREFLIKKGGRWIGNKAGLFEISQMMESNKKFEETFKDEDLVGKECFISIDLANTTDTNGVSLMFKGLDANNNEIPIMKSHVFIPRDTLDRRESMERKPYSKWVEDGYITLCGKKSVDFAVIANYIKNLLNKYKVKKILYDQYYAHIVKSYLIDIHKISEHMFEAVKQNAETISSPMEDLIKKVVDLRFYYLSNPVTLDHFLNMAPSFTRNGQMYYQKTKQTQRIDLWSTAVTAMVKFGELNPISVKSDGGMDIWQF